MIFEGGIAQAARALAATPLAPSLATLPAGTHLRLNAAIGAHLSTSWGRKGERQHDFEYRHCAHVKARRKTNSAGAADPDVLQIAYAELLRCMSPVLADFVAEVGDDRCVATGANFFK